MNSEWPRITIVTPSFNQGRYIERTIQSVLSQQYPNLEYMIFDGGSSDETLSIIEKYQHQLSFWVSEADKGPAHAINKGLERATGVWFNWLNSDDILMPGALQTLVSVARIAGDPSWIAGASLFMDPAGKFVDVYSRWQIDPSILAMGIPHFPQDATFIKLEFLRRHGKKLREDFSNVFDTYLHAILLRHADPVLTTAIFSAMTLHPLQRTAHLAKAGREIEELNQLWVNRPLLFNMLLRLSRTRLHRLARYMLGGICRYGMSRTSRDWRAVTFNHRNYDWENTPARLATHF